MNRLFRGIGLHANGIRDILRPHGIAAPIRSNRHLHTLHVDALFCRLSKNVVAITSADRKQQELAAIEPKAHAASVFGAIDGDCPGPR